MSKGQHENHFMGCWYYLFNWLACCYRRSENDILMLSKDIVAGPPVQVKAEISSSYG